MSSGICHSTHNGSLSQSQVSGRFWLEILTDLSRDVAAEHEVKGTYPSKFLRRLLLRPTRNGNGLIGDGQLNEHPNQDNEPARSSRISIHDEPRKRLHHTEPELSLHVQAAEPPDSL